MVIEKKKGKQEWQRKITMFKANAESQYHTPICHTETGAKFAPPPLLFRHGILINFRKGHIWFNFGLFQDCTLGSFSSTITPLKAGI